MDFSVFRLRFAEHRHECGFLLGCVFAEKMFNYWTHSYLDLHTNIAFAPSHVNLDFKQFFVRFVFMDDDIEYYDGDDDMSYSGEEKTFRRDSWERKDGCWYEFVDGYWSKEDYGNPDKPPRSYSEALKYRSCTSSLYSLDNDPNYTEEEKAKIRANEAAIEARHAAEKAEREKQEAREFEILMAMLIVLVILGFVCAWLSSK